MSDGGRMVPDFLRDRARQAGEAAHLHQHREILAFDVAGVDLIGNGSSESVFSSATFPLNQTRSFFRATFFFALPVSRWAFLDDSKQFAIAKEHVHKLA
jgi:hypothetical protein